MNTGVVVQHIDAAEGVGSATHKALHLVFAGHVTALEDRLTATAPDIGGQRLALGAVEIRDHHAGAALGRQPGRARANTRGRAGNQDNQVVHAHGNGLPPRRFRLI